MESLNLPKCDLRIARNNSRLYVWDILRRKYIVLTPEEWVRQHFIHFLISCKGYPATLLANEISIKQNGMTRRCDTVLYNRMAQPQMIIEYKAPHIKITPDVFDQISRYNMVLRVKYLIVSNGREHYCCQTDFQKNSYRFLQEIPDFSQL